VLQEAIVPPPPRLGSISLLALTGFACMAMWVLLALSHDGRQLVIGRALPDRAGNPYVFECNNDGLTIVSFDDARGDR
jgi:hypothetical protein